jgi:hypothetical protein
MQNLLCYIYRQVIYLGFSEEIKKMDHDPFINKQICTAIAYEDWNAKIERKPGNSSGTCDYVILTCLYYEATHVKVTVLGSMITIVKVL